MDLVYAVTIGEMGDRQNKMAAISMVSHERKLRNAERRQHQIAACNMGNRTT